MLTLAASFEVAIFWFTAEVAESAKDAQRL